MLHDMLGAHACLGFQDDVLPPVCRDMLGGNGMQVARLGKWSLRPYASTDMAEIGTRMRSSVQRMLLKRFH